MNNPVGPIQATPTQDVITPAYLKGIATGISVPLACLPLDSLSQYFITGGKEATAEKFLKKFSCDPLFPYRNGGLSTALVSNTIKYGTLLGSIEPIKKLYMEMFPQSPIASEIGAAATAGVLEAITTAPTSYVVTQIRKAQLQNIKTSPIQILTEIPTEKRFSTLFSNLRLSALRNAAFAVVFFPLIGPLSRAISPKDSERSFVSSVALNALSTGLAGTAALSLSQPFSNAAIVGRSLGGVSDWAVLKKIYTETGIKGFYKGLPSSAPRMFLASAITGLAIQMTEKSYHKGVHLIKNAQIARFQSSDQTKEIRSTREFHEDEKIDNLIKRFFMSFSSHD